jgi:hypothetical protein
MINSDAMSFLRSAVGRLALCAPNPTENHHAFREGTKLGIIVATVTWLWVLLIDVASGDAFRTPTMLGGIVVFTVVHLVLNLAYGVSLVSVINGAAREPSLITAALFGFVMVEIGFIMIAAVLSNFLGGIAWVSLLGGSLIGAAIAFQLIAPRYPLGALLRQAETER